MSEIPFGYEDEYTWHCALWDRESKRRALAYNQAQADVISAVKTYWRSGGMMALVQAAERLRKVVETPPKTIEQLIAEEDARIAAHES